MMKSFIILLFFSLPFLIVSCEQKVNEPDNSIKISGTWELTKLTIVYPDSTVELRLGVNTQNIFRVFADNGGFEQVESGPEGEKYSTNLWTLANNVLTLKFSGIPAIPDEKWTVTLADSALTLERQNQRNGQSVIEKAIYKSSYKNQFRNDAMFAQTWKLASELIAKQDTSFVNIPEETGINETLTFLSNSTFTRSINHNGQVSETNGNWFASYFLMVLKASSGKVEVFVHEVDPELNILRLKYSYVENGYLVIVQKEYNKG